MKKLIIVCEEKCKIYGDYLSQLISLDDDTDDTTVGTKDGSVAAQVWFEEDYTANAAHISSDQYILFIGNDKLIKGKSTHMKIVFSKFGMTYGWLGKQAVLSVEKAVQESEYNNFISFALDYQTDIDTLIKKQSDRTALKEKTFSPKKAALLVIQPYTEIERTVKKFTLSNKIKKQQYSFGVMKFYIDSLSEFLCL